MFGRTEGGATDRKRRLTIRHLWIRVFGCFLGALFTSPALAHASDRGHVLLLPTGYYLLGGAAAVAASFFVLIAVRPKPGAVEAPPEPIDGLWSTATGESLCIATSLAAFAVLAVLVAAGFLGSRDPLSNPLPLTIWTLLWVGLTLVQGFLGNLWAWINPWYGFWLAVLALLGRVPDDLPPLRLPDRIGAWPAVLLFFAFAWFELVYPAPDDPARLAWAVSLYWCATFVAMLLFGFNEWSKRGEFLSVFFGMISRFGIVQRSQRLRFGWPGAKLAAVTPLILSGTLFLLLALSSVSFDGFSKTFFWLGANGINPLDYPGRSALMVVNGVGLLMAFVALAGVYFVAVLAGERMTASRAPFFDAAGLMIWSIVPIALAYHFSHYLTALLVNGQYALVALSDPFARGWNLFGTAEMHVSAGVAMGSWAAWAIWNFQAAAIVGGHILAVVIAHRLSHRLHDGPRQAIIGQIPLTILMVAYTVFGLWLLSTPTAG